MKTTISISLETRDVEEVKKRAAMLSTSLSKYLAHIIESSNKDPTAWLKRLVEQKAEEHYAFSKLLKNLQAENTMRETATDIAAELKKAL